MKNFLSRVFGNYIVMIAILTGMIGTVGFFLHYHYWIQQEGYCLQHQKSLETVYQAAVQMYRLSMDSFYDSIIAVETNLRVFASGVDANGEKRKLAIDRLYQQLFPAYITLKNHHLLDLHFHLADGTSYLRFQQSDRLEESLPVLRPSVSIVNREHRPIHGFEIGRVQSGLWFVYPVRWHGRYLGSVEVRVTTKALQDAMAQLEPHSEYLFVLSRNQFEPFIFSDKKWLYRVSHIHPDFIIEDANAYHPDSLPPLSVDALVASQHIGHNPRVKMAISNGEAITVRAASGARSYLVTLLPIHDVVGQVAGYLVTFAKDQTFRTFQRDFLIYITAASAALGLITALLMGLHKRTVELSVAQRNRTHLEKALKRANIRLKAAIIKARKMTAKAESASRAKSIFLTHMSHEIRTPLNAILGYSQLLQTDQSLGSEVLKQIQTINRSGDYLLELFNSIFEMSQIETGHIQIRPESMDFKRLLNDIIAMFHLACQKKNLILTMEKISPLPNLIVADRGKIRQILINLMSNAVKFTTTGSITLRSTAQLNENHHWAICIDVIDSGAGIPEELQSSLFKGFEQTTARKNTALKGSGLGLPISQAYARAIGGDLQLVESVMDQGTVFRFTFTAEKNRGVLIDEKEKFYWPKKIIGSGSAHDCVRALIVGDDPISRALLQKILENGGFDVHAVASGPPALNLFPSFRPDILLLDFSRPGHDEFEIAQQIRRLPGGALLKILAMSDSSIHSDDFRHQAEASGVDDSVCKPFKISEIYEKIKTLCAIEYVFEEPAAANPADTDSNPPGQEMEKVPDYLRVALKSAVEHGDMQEFAVLADQVISIDRHLGTYLKALAHRYDYATLLDVL